MLLSVRLPEPTFEAQTCVVRAVHVDENTVVEPGSKIIDLSVDLSAGQSFNCAPTAYYRLATSEGGLLRHVDVSVGQEIDTATIIALLSTEGETTGATPERAARVVVASILHHDDWWEAL